MSRSVIKTPLRLPVIKVKGVYINIHKVSDKDYFKALEIGLEALVRQGKLNLADITN